MIINSTNNSIVKKALLFVMLLFPLVVSADDDGFCGGNVSYFYSNSTHTLYISGSGPMADYANANDVPWKDYRTLITSVNIQSGVTSIGNNAFMQCTGITSVAIPNSVTSIGDYAFYRCSSLTGIDIPEGITSIGDGAFSGCI